MFKIVTTSSDKQRNEVSRVKSSLLFEACFAKVVESLAKIGSMGFVVVRNVLIAALNLGCEINQPLVVKMGVVI